MTDKEIQKLIKSAYFLPESKEEIEFIKRHEKRSLRIFEIVKHEFSFMGVQSIFSAIILCLVFYVLSKSESIDLVWGASAFLPVCSVIPILFLEKSNRYGMNELEAASRFSLRFIKLVRAFIVGIFSLILIGGVCLILSHSGSVRGIEFVMLIAFPYMLSNCLAMHVARKWHRKDNIIGLILVCLLCSVVPFGVRAIINMGQIATISCWIVFIATAVVLVREFSMYIRESENLSWNLC